MKLYLHSMAEAALEVGVLCLLNTHVVSQEVVCANVDRAMKTINDSLASQGANYRLDNIDLYGKSGDAGRDVTFCDRGNKQYPEHWVPDDPRREWSLPGSITVVTDNEEGATSSGLSAVQTSEAIGRAIQTWNDVQCSNIQVVDYGAVDFEYFGIVQYLYYLGALGSLGKYPTAKEGIPAPVADIRHGGFLPPTFFDDTDPPTGSQSVLGIAFIFAFIDTETGEFTDIDNNGKQDTAFVEINYNDKWDWQIDADIEADEIDVESVALHEMGHALSQDHFGKAFRTKKNGKLHFAPFAVMNALYSGRQQKLTGSDIAGHCSIWGSWPNN